MKLNDQPVSGMLSHFESQQSPTFRELKAIFYVIKAHVASVRHKKVKVFTDNKNTSRIVSVGSPKQHLQCLVLDIFQLCLVNDIQIEAQWIPRDANVRADLLSRFVDKGDWSLNCEFLPSWIPDGARILLIDLPLITSRFNSRFLSPGCCAVDGLSQDWHDENNRLCPQVSIIVDVIRHARACRAVGTLIIPEWRSAFFWPLLKPRPSRDASFVVDVVRLPRRSALITPGPGQKIFYRGKPSVFFGCPKFSMPVLRIDLRLASQTCLFLYLPLICFRFCLHCSAFTCGSPNGLCVACVCYVCRADSLCQLLHSCEF